MNYEEIMAKLLVISNRLKQEQISLEEATALYTEGMQLSAQCHEILQKAVLTIKEIPVPDKMGEENSHD